MEKTETPDDGDFPSKSFTKITKQEDGFRAPGSSKEETKKQMCYGTQVCNAFELDCQVLLGRYETLQNVSYQAFADVWKELNFTLIYGNLDECFKVMVFVENVFKVTKQFVSVLTNRFTKVGAFYLLYGLYYKQPYDGWIKVRLTMVEYKALLDLTQYEMGEGNVEPIFMLAKMKRDGALVHVATTDAMKVYRAGKGYRTRYGNPTDSFRAPQLTAVESLGKLLMMGEGGAVGQFERISQEYEQAKLENPDECKGFLPVQSTIVKDLNKLYNKMNDITEEVDENKKETQATIDEIRRLKMKAMQMVGTTSRFNFNNT